VKEYYEKRAPEYDDVWLGTGLYAQRDRPGWDEEREALIAAIAALPPARTLDVACGTGFLTRHLPGDVTGLDQSVAMLAIASERIPQAEFIHADAFPLPFPDNSFDRVFTSFFYGHLEERERVEFVAEARRVARELVVVDSSQARSSVSEHWQPRILNDGSRWQVYKRYFTAEELASELGGGEILLASRYFVAVRAQAGAATA